VCTRIEHARTGITNAQAAGVGSRSRTFPCGGASHSLANCVPGQIAWSGGAAERMFQMVLLVSVAAGLLLLAYCVSRVRAKRQAKKRIETLFYTK
jgi:hypothetical protein